MSIKLARALISRCEGVITRWGHLKDSNGSLTAFFLGLDHVIVNTAWLLLLLVACTWFNLPRFAASYLGTATTIYLVISVGVLIIRATSVIVETLDGLSRRYAESRDWLHFYDRLRPLVPLFRRCLEAALWIGVASLVVAQLSPIAVFAEHGTRLIMVIGIFFVGRVLIEVGYLVIGLSLHGDKNADDLERRRRATIIPLFCSIFRYACYFGMFICVLPVFGRDPTPFLAGIGAVGVVFGFGAQSLIADVVAGFFILFENVYLVGDMIEGAGASGQVEAIEFRTTRIRDADGRLHIVRNGDMKQVINYSKDYSKAIVAVDVPYEADVRRIFAILLEAGAKLKAENLSVLAATEIEGITGFGGANLTIRTSTRVNPGQHIHVAVHLRLLIKEAMDACAATIKGPRLALVPALPALPFLVAEPGPRGDAAKQTGAGENVPAPGSPA